ncbi:unnamed protein product [Prorocentrum cordatum]|uniref:Derlin n=1 Tax=Prorocentrum cordatum TaxID=2364126 RepID=A0ABN9WQL3_9DINO|nr:unnamed protein product [Polarella glacialis]
MLANAVRCSWDSVVAPSVYLFGFTIYFHLLVHVTCRPSSSRSTRWASAAAMSSKRSRTSSSGVVCKMGPMMVLGLCVLRCPSELTYVTELALCHHPHVKNTALLTPTPMVSLTLYCMTFATSLEPPVAVFPVAMPRLKLFAMVLGRFPNTFLYMELGLFLGVALALLNLLCIPLPPVVLILVTLVMSPMLVGPPCMPLPLVALNLVMFLFREPPLLVAPDLVLLAMPALLSVHLSATGIELHGARRYSRIGRSYAASTRGSTLWSAT